MMSKYVIEGEIDSSDLPDPTRPYKDTDYAAVKLRGVLGDYDPDELFYFKHLGAPVSKSRARWSRKTQRFYTPKKTSDEEDALAARFVEMMDGRPPISGAIAIVAVFYRPNFQRIDADNLMKLVMDAATRGGAWADDCQVTAQASFMEYDKDNPRTLVAWCKAESTLDRDGPGRFVCRVCGDRFNRKGTAALKNPPKYCSRKCHLLGIKVDARCPRCGTVFIRSSSGQRYCSVECRVATVNSPERRKKRQEQRPPPRCQECGGRVSRREYIRCSDCSPKGRKRGSKNKPKVYGSPERVEIEVLEG